MYQKLNDLINDPDYRRIQLLMLKVDSSSPFLPEIYIVYKPSAINQIRLICLYLTLLTTTADNSIRLTTLIVQSKSKSLLISLL